MEEAGNGRFVADAAHRLRHQGRDGELLDVATADVLVRVHPGRATVTFLDERIRPRRTQLQATLKSARRVAAAATVGGLQLLNRCCGALPDSPCLAHKSSGRSGDLDAALLV